MPWLDDKLAVVATGGMLKRRLYYTTNQLVEYDSRSHSQSRETAYSRQVYYTSHAQAPASAVTSNAGVC